MKDNERGKAQRALNKIQSGEFNEDQVDTLFTKLREYCSNHRLFREVGDFVAHNKVRDQGISQEFLEGYCLSLWYALEYGLHYNSPNFAKEPFPSYVKRFMLRQVDKCKPDELKKQFKIDPIDLKRRIEKSFKVDKKTNTAVLREPIGQEAILAIKHLLGFINFDPLFKAGDLMADLVAVLKENQFRFERSAIRTQQGTIVLCVMLLMHQTKFEFEGIPSCESFIMTEPLGTISVCGVMEHPSAPGPMWFCPPIFTSDLAVNAYCEESLLAYLISQEVPGNFLVNQSLCLTKNSKLGLFHPLANP